MELAPDWTMYLIQTSTGKVGPQVEAESTSFDIALNGIESLSTSLKKSSLPQGLNLDNWLAPWWSGVLLTWRGYPMFAGPMISRPQETATTIKLNCSGIRAVLMNRLVAQEFTDWSKLPKSTIHFEKMSLATIAKRVVQASLEKSGGSLPIAYPVPDEIFTGPSLTHERNYEGFNISNLSTDAVLTKLSEVVAGPDVMFRPRLLDASRLVWDMWTGTNDSPRISQSKLPVWDISPTQGQVADLSIVSTGSYMVNRVYSVGAGQDQGTLITVSEDLTNVVKGAPLLEATIAVSQSADTKVVRAHGEGVLAGNIDMLREITLTVRADGIYPLNSYHCGDAMDIYTRGWLTFKDGQHRCRLLHIQVNLSNPATVRLSLQPEKYIGS